jgi:hypothetical protein
MNNKIITDRTEKANALVNQYEMASSNQGYPPQFIGKKVEGTRRALKKADDEPDFENKLYHQEFTLYELNRALQNCKSGAPGEDNIHYNIIKNFPEETKLTLLANV